MKSERRLSFGNALIFAVLFVTLVFASVGCVSGATAPEEEWDKTFGGTESDWAYSVQQTSDGGYVLAGYTESYGAGDGDAWLIKTDSNGNKEWSKTFGGTEADGARSVQQTSDGGYILAGYTRSYGAGGDAWLIKTDSNGNEIFDEVFGGYKSDSASAVQQTSDGGYILAGDTMSYGAGGDALLIKTDSNGKKEWDKTFGGADLDMMSSVQQTSDGGYIVAGYTRSYGAGRAGAWLIKLKGKPTPTVTPTVTPTTTTQTEKDSDGDGVPDEYDYAPNDPNVQTKDDVKIPGFGAIFALCSLLAVVFGLRRWRKRIRNSE